MQNTVYYKGDLVSAQFSGHHQTCIPAQLKKLYKLLVYLGERDFFLYTDV